MQSTIPKEVEDLGASAVKIFRALLTHEGMSRKAIAEKSGVQERTCSPLLTYLRRTGWVEYEGRKNKRLWRRRKEWNDPQPDLVRRKGKNDVDDKDALYHLTEAARHLNTAIRLVKPLVELQAAARKTFEKK